MNAFRLVVLGVSFVGIVVGVGLLVALWRRRPGRPYASKWYTAHTHGGGGLPHAHPAGGWRHPQPNSHAGVAVATREQALRGWLAQANLRPSAEELRPFRGRQVAVTDGHVVFAGRDAAEVIEWLRANGRAADTTFRVPLDYEEDRCGH